MLAQGFSHNFKGKNGRNSDLSSPETISISVLTPSPGTPCNREVFLFCSPSGLVTMPQACPSYECRKETICFMANGEMV